MVEATDDELERKLKELAAKSSRRGADGEAKAVAAKPEIQPAVIDPTVSGPALIESPPTAPAQEPVPEPISKPAAQPTADAAPVAPAVAVAAPAGRPQEMVGANAGETSGETIGERPGEPWLE